MARGAKSASGGGTLRSEVEQVLSQLKGGSSAALAHGAADPFSERNDWEDSQRRKGAKGAVAAAQPHARPQSKSRRAQQAFKAKTSREDAQPQDKPAQPRPGAAADGLADGRKAARAAGAGGPVLLPICVNWWEEMQRPAADAVALGSLEQLEHLREQAETLYERELGAFEAQQSRRHKSDNRFVNRMISQGTFKDRIAALTVAAQESSFHCLPHLRQLLAMAARPARDVKMAAVAALLELTLARLLPERPLTAFERQQASQPPTERQLLQVCLLEATPRPRLPRLNLATLENGSQKKNSRKREPLSHGNLSLMKPASLCEAEACACLLFLEGASCFWKAPAVSFARFVALPGVRSSVRRERRPCVCVMRAQAHFEDALKRCYAQLAEIVIKGAGDNVIHCKQRMLSSISQMLSGRPELERLLLPALVNKLGDPEKRVASRLTHLLGQLVHKHPAMKPVVLAEVQRFVLRPNVGERAQYYATVFMNQIVLTRKVPFPTRGGLGCSPPEECWGCFGVQASLLLVGAHSHTVAPPPVWPRRRGVSRSHSRIAALVSFAGGGPRPHAASRLPLPLRRPCQRRKGGATKQKRSRRRA